MAAAVGCSDRRPSKLRAQKISPERKPREPPWVDFSAMQHNRLLIHPDFPTHSIAGKTLVKLSHTVQSVKAKHSSARASEFCSATHSRSAPLSLLLTPVRPTVSWPPADPPS